MSARIGYLVSQYPAANHTFILREVLGLRQLGIDVNVASIRSPDRDPAAMTQDERDEAEHAMYVMRRGVPRIVADHVATFFRRPLGYLRGVAAAVQLGGTDPRRVARSLMYFGEAVIVGRWMERSGLRHLHTHFSATVAYLTSVAFPVTISATIHGPAEFDDTTGTQLGRKVQACSFVCAISDYGRSQVMLASDPSMWDRIEVARLGIDPARYAPQRRRPNASPFRIVMVGRLAPVKAQRLLVQAVAGLRAEGRDVHLTLVGSGPDADALRDLANNLGVATAVQLTGPLNQDQVLAVYAESDCFVLPSFAEGIPVVLMEAMAVGLPCIATRITGIPELIRDGGDGLLVTPGSVPALMNATRAIMDDQILRARLARSARERVMAQYDLRVNVELLAAIFARRLGVTTARKHAATDAENTNPAALSLI